MTILRWLSVIVSAALLVAVIVANIRNAKTIDPMVLRRSSRRIGWSVAASFVFSFALYAVAVVRTFSAVAAAASENRVAVLAIAIEASAVYLRWSVGCLVLTLIGLFVMRFRAGYNTPESKS